jgi:Phytanoyl-CoA dioxygenase (PhyH)
MQLTDAEQTLLPNAEDCAFFHEHGYWISPPIYSEREIEDARYGVERFYSGDCDFPLTGHVRQMTGWKAGDPDAQRTNDYVSLLIREVMDFVAKPVLGAMAARLAGTNSIRLWHDQLIVKNPGGDPSRSGVGWHIDKAYWQTCSSDAMLTAWIPLHDTDSEIGPLLVIDGSHRWPDTGSLRGFHITDLSQSANALAERIVGVAPIPIVVKAGQVSFHHCQTVHGSGANRSGRPRMSFSLHLQDAANQYREVRDASGEIVWHRNDILCRKKDGRPDYTDPDICPVLWAT